MNKKKFLEIGLAALIIIFGFWQLFFSKGKNKISSILVSRGDIFEEITETGKIIRGEKINLTFKNTGQISKIYVKVGDQVKMGQSLVKLDTTQIEIQLKQAQADLKAAQAKLDKLLAGATPEEIEIAQTKVQNAQIALEIAQENLTQAYEDALLTLESAYLDLDNTLNTVSDIQRTYFNINDQEGIKVKNSKNKIEDALAEAKSYLDLAKEDSQNEKIDTALSEMKKNLEITSEALETIRQMCETPLYRNQVSSTDKTSLDTQRSNINTALSDISNTQQTISSLKLDVESAKSELKLAKNNLAELTAKPRKEDVELYKAQVEQVKAQIALLENKIEESILKSPTEAKVVKINKEIGELVQPVLAGSVIELLPTNPFQVEVDIYEEDIVKVDIGDKVEITLPAFPDQKFTGKVVSIEPAEELIEGVVYYKTKIDFEGVPKNLKPGMTADISITKILKENVIVIPEEALKTQDDKILVEVLKGKKTEEREIKIGTRGSEGKVEVISGLKEGEQVIIK